MGKYYAVAVGRKTGVFTSWTETANNVLGYSGACFKSFSTEAQAKEFVEKHLKTDAAPVNPVPRIEDVPVVHVAKKVKVDDDDVFTMFFDGGSRGNGRADSVAGAGYVIKNPQGDGVYMGTIYLGSATNNQSEYAGLERGLVVANEHGIKKMIVKGDSELAIKQMNGVYQVKNAGIKKIHERLDVIRAKFEMLKFVHVLRDDNREADALSNVAMDEKTSFDW